MPSDGAPIQGLRIALDFADTRNPIEVLQNLNLNINDLDKIRGIAAETVERADIQSISGLAIDLEKEAIAISNEVNSYQNVLSTLNDGRRRIGGNLDISGKIIAPTFKFRTINFDENNAIATVDFSTSRASAWSAFGNASESVFYGGDVILRGSTSTIELSSLEFANQPKRTRFKAQIPTHKFRVSIDGEEYDLYAMKGIPIQFKGFFRSVRDLRIDYINISNIKPSWIIRNRNGQEFVYDERGTDTGTIRQSIISFFDSRAEEREIEFYYPVENITRIDLNNARIFELPNVQMPELRTLNVINGDFIEMPDIAFLYPTIQNLNLSRNDLTRSDDPNLRLFSPSVIQRLKTQQNTLRSLILDGVYSNDNTADLSELVGLQTFRSSSGATNSRRMTGTSPAVSKVFEREVATTATQNSNTVELTSASDISSGQRMQFGNTIPRQERVVDSVSGNTVTLTESLPQQISQGDSVTFFDSSTVRSYGINGNRFSTLHPSVSASTEIISLDIRSNGIGGVIDSSSGTNLENIETFVTGGNSHQIVDMNGKTNLKTYTTSDQSFSGGTAGRTGTGIFVNCPSLEEIRINNTNVLGNLPNFSTNTSLRFFASWSTGWGNAVQNNSIGEFTFGQPDSGCRPTLDYFNLQSGGLTKPIHPNAFATMRSIRTLVVISFNRMVGDQSTPNVYPISINDCSNLRTLRLDRNNMTGQLPNFAGNQRLVTLILSQNEFTGVLPAINLPNLRTLFLQNNNLTELQGLQCIRLTQLNVSFNNLNIMPSLRDEAFRIQTLLLNNNLGESGNGMSYRNGELEFLISLRRLEMANCGFNRGTIDQILVDLNENYNRNPRRNVSINLLGNSSPSATEEIATIINRLRREGWTIGLEP